MTLKAKVVLLTLLLGALAQAVVLGVVFHGESGRAEFAARGELDVAERLVNARLSQLREQGMLAAALAARDPVLLRGLASGAGEAVNSLLAGHARRTARSICAATVECSPRSTSTTCESPNYVRLWSVRR